MAGTGANALFTRVRKITVDLHESGAKDRAENTARHTFKLIDDEGHRLFERFEGKQPDHRRPEAEHSAFGNQISYLHNEFNFDVALPIGDIALVTHTSFIPVFPPKYVKATDRDLPRYKTVRPEAVSQALIDRLADLRRKAIHEPEGAYTDETFFGGKDEIIKTVNRFHSFDQPVITTMRSIERLNAFINDSFRNSGDSAVEEAARLAAEANEKRDLEVASHGMSSRLSMHRNFALRCSKSGDSKWRLGWERHHSHYQTLVAVEYTHAALVDGARISDEERATVPTLAELVDDLRKPSSEDRQILLDRTALDALPEEWPRYLYGRYLQGANYLLLPAAMLFEPSHLSKCETVGHGFGTTPEPWHDLSDRVLRLCGVPHQYGHKVNLSLEQFKEAWAKARGDNVKLRPASELALRLLRPLINILFANKTENRFEFVMFGAAGGAAIVVSDVRNFGSSGRRPLMSATVIIDLGMNQFERGRLLKHLTEFSTQRFLSLHTLGSFRFFGDVLDVLNEELIDATNIWMDNGDSNGETSKQDGRFIEKLQELTTNLTLLNSLVNGGIVVHGTSVDASRERVTSHIDGIGHYPLPGFMGMTEFLDRRYFKSVRTISAVTRRYQLLRERIAQLSSLVEAKVEIEQDKRHLKEVEKQSSLLSKAETLTKWGVAYYSVQVLSYGAIGFIILAVALKLVLPWETSVHDGAKALNYLLSSVALLLVGAVLLGESAKLGKRSWGWILTRVLGIVLFVAAIASGSWYIVALTEKGGNRVENPTPHKG